MNSSPLEFPSDLIATIVYLYLFLKGIIKKNLTTHKAAAIHRHTHLHVHFIHILLPFICVL